MGIQAMHNPFTLDLYRGACARHFYDEVRLHYHINCLVCTFLYSGRMRWRGHNDRMSLSLRTVLLGGLPFILSAQFVLTEGGKVHVVLCEPQPISRTGHNHTTSNLVFQNDSQLRLVSNLFTSG